jgi:prepilin-type N-terminal cleavage/methylation domain-containing protein
MNRSVLGFTLIELSIVLVIIGLIVGGVLVGQDLISTATARAQVSQIEKYQTAVNTFRGKYGYLPGDIKDPEATQFGLAARDVYAGQGDGNGVIEGVSCEGSGCNAGTNITSGEIAVFWNDLGVAGLISEKLTTATQIFVPVSNGVAVSLYMPRATAGNENYIHVWSTGSVNYFAISSYTHMGWAMGDAYASMPVRQAAYIDTKIDDGLPQTGNVLAQYVTWESTHVGVTWAAGGTVNVGGWLATSTVGASPGAAAMASAASCYDNGNNAGAIMRYSLAQNGGAGTNCALSIRFR